MKAVVIKETFNNYTRFVTAGVFIVFIVITSFRCTEKYTNVSKGTLTVFADESLMKAVQETADSFMVLYPESKITVVSAASRVGIAKILNGEANIFVSSRKFNSEEQLYKQKNAVELKTIKYVYDGVICIARSESKFSNLSFDSLKLLIAGKVAGIKVFAPEINSGVTEYLQTVQLPQGDSLTVNLLNSEKEVFEQVEKQNNAIGFIGWNNFQPGKNVKFLFIGSEKQGGITSVYYEPHPGYFVQKLYPCTRECVVFLSEVRLGLATGFASFLSANQGQRIALQNNLGPAAVPVRLVQ